MGNDENKECDFTIRLRGGRSCNVIMPVKKLLSKLNYGKATKDSPIIEDFVVIGGVIINRNHIEFITWEELRCRNIR